MKGRRVRGGCSQYQNQIVASSLYLVVLLGNGRIGEWMGCLMMVYTCRLGNASYGVSACAFHVYVLLYCYCYRNRARNLSCVP